MKKIDIYELKKINTVSVSDSGIIGINTIEYNGKFLELLKFYVDKTFRSEINFSNDILLKDYFPEERYGSISSIHRNPIYPYYPHQDIIANQYTAVGYIAIDSSDIPIRIKGLLEKFK